MSVKNSSGYVIILKIIDKKVKNYFNLYFEWFSIFMDGQVIYITTVYPMSIMRLYNFYELHETIN